jgi:uncharacterized coiled-coil protein SlyX
LNLPTGLARHCQDFQYLCRELLITFAYGNGGDQLGEDQKPREIERSHELWWLRANRWGGGAVVLFLVIAGLALSYGIRQRAIISDLSSNEAGVSVTIGQMQRQLDTLAAKLDEISAQTAPAPPTDGPGAMSGHSDATVAIAKRATTEADRWKEMQARIDQQQKQLNETKASLAQTRVEFEKSLNATHRELNETVAKTHEELIALQKRGERNYFEFDLSKSKQFQRWGPVMLSLRKADPKHQSFDLVILVNDEELTKKKINLYEPVWIYEKTGQQPLQVVVNRISKDLVHGYVSAPKYSQEELASNVTPVSAPSSVPSQTTNSQLQPIR